MADFRERYKRVGFGREDVDVNRVLRSQRRDEARHEERSEQFSLRRDLGSQDEDDDESDVFFEPQPPSAREKRNQLQQQQQRTRAGHSPGDSKRTKTAAESEVAVQKKLLELEQWQKEKARKKIEEKKKVKPAFKVGVVHHKIYSPPLNKDPAPVPPAKLCKHIKAEEKQPPPKRVTRATEKRLAAKAVTNQQRREDIRNKKPAVAKCKAKSPKAPFAPRDHQFRAPVGVTPLPMFGRLASELDSKNLITAPANDVSSVSSFGKNFSTTLENSVFVRNSETLKTSKITNKSNLRPCDSTTNNSQGSNTSVESVSLKLSSDDQEMQSDREDVEFSMVRLNTPKLVKSSSIKKRRSTRKSMNKAPDTSEHTSAKDHKIVSQDQQDQMMEVQESSSSSSQNHSAVVNSTTTNRNRISAKSKDASLVKHDQEMADTSYSNQSVSKSFNDNANEKPVEKAGSMSESIEVIDIKLKTTMLDSPLSNSSKPLARRRSMRSNKSQSEQIAEEDDVQTVNSKDQEITASNSHSNLDLESSAMNKSTSSRKLKRSKPVSTRKSARFAPTRSEEEEEKEKEVAAAAVDTPMDQESTEVEEDSAPDTSKTRKSGAGRRKSMKIQNDENAPTDVPMEEVAPLDNPEVTVGRESVFDLQSKHLLDITLSDLNKVKSQKRKKSVKINSETAADLEDQSLIKFSPRQSMRLQIEKSKQQADLVKVSSTTNTLEVKTAEQSLISFDPLIAKSNEKLNETTSSEPTKQKSPNSLNGSQNFSLNLTLPTEERPPAFYSPYIVTSRGKENIRKEVHKRRFSHRSPGDEDDIPTKETVMQSLNISAEEEERTAQYYKFILDKEIERLNECCDNWNAIKEDESTPEDIRYLIQAAVGHTQLLINKKFQRFRGLVLDCETGKGEMLVTCKDLQGFWEMMYMEIKDVDGRFNKLVQLKANNWVEEQSEEAKEAPKPKKKPAVAKKPAPKKKPPAKSSSLRAHILAARKKKLESKESDTEPVVAAAEADNEKTNEQEKPKASGTPRSARRPSSTPKSISKWQSVVRKSSGRKSMPSPLVVMKLSQMCKTPEVQLDDSVIYINSDRTPAKGILKGKPKDEVSMLSVTKSTNKVFFKEQPMEVQEFDKDCYDRDSSEFEKDDREPVERKLDFENDSFNVEEEKTADKPELRHSPVVSLFSIVPSPSKKSRTPRAKKQILFDEGCDGSTRVLRSQALTKELFLNQDGVITERYVPVTPKVQKLKRSNSERTTRNTRSSKVEDPDASTNETPRTPRLRRRASQKSENKPIDSPYPVNKVLNESKKTPLTPTPRTRKSLKRTNVEADLSDSEGTPTAVEPSPKTTRRTPKIIKTLDSTNVSDGSEKVETPRLRRVKSLNAADSKKVDGDTGEKTPRSRLRRASSRSKADLKEDGDKTLTPTFGEKSLKVT